LSPVTTLENYADEQHIQKRRPKRPSIQAMIKAAKKAGLEISSIECDEDGVRLVCGARSTKADSDESELDRRMTEQMGVAEVSGMAAINIPFYVVKRNNRAYWQPQAALRKLGFQSIPLGPDGPDAKRVQKHALSVDTCERLERYLARAEEAGIELGPDEPLLRQPDGWRPYIKDRWERHFRLTREEIMPGDTRVMLDIRRTANVEADIGGMSREDRAELLANNLDKSAFLEATYTPSTVVKSHRSLSKRAKAQALIEAEAKGQKSRCDGTSLPHFDGTGGRSISTFRESPWKVWRE
jgi:hypothetical protein